jgi:hypothetical protein
MIEMSFSISIEVKDGQAEVRSITTGDGAPPDGSYSINGHVHHGDDAPPYIAVTTPIGMVQAHLQHSAYLAKETE